MANLSIVIAGHNAVIAQVGRLEHLFERCLIDRHSCKAIDGRLGIERFEMAYTADHEQPDDAFGPGWGIGMILRSGSGTVAI